MAHWLSWGGEANEVANLDRSSSANLLLCPPLVVFKLLHVLFGEAQGPLANDVGTDPKPKADTLEAVARSAASEEPPMTCPRPSLLFQLRAVPKHDPILGRADDDHDPERANTGVPSAIIVFDREARRITNGCLLHGVTVTCRGLAVSA